MPCEFTETGDAADRARPSTETSGPRRVGAPLRVCVLGESVQTALFDSPLAGSASLVAESFSCHRAALQRLSFREADVLVVETGPSFARWESFVRDVRRLAASTRILAVAPRAHAITGLRAMQAGAHGYLSGRDWRSKLREAVETVAQNRLYLTGRLNDHLLRCALREDTWALGSPVDLLSDRELEVLEKLGRRRGVREVAAELRLSVKTVETHRSNIARKLGLVAGTAVTEFGASWLAAHGLVAAVDHDDPTSA